MPEKQKQNILNTISHREKLRPLGRIRRLFADPLGALPYYVLATFSHIKPYRISFKTLWNDTMTGYLPEANTFYYYGYCEANLTAFLLRYLKSGMTFIDVGAHIGFYSMLAGKLVEVANDTKTGGVYSFEPTPWTYQLLLKNTAALGNVHTTNVGVSDSIGEIVFSDYGPGYGAYNSASNEGTILKHAPKKITLPTVTLDGFCEKHTLRPDFIKLDAEGFEHKILLGMIKIIQANSTSPDRHSRPLITLEMANDEMWSENCKKSADTLFAAGYVSYEMSDTGFIKPCLIEKTYTYSNILFVPQEKVHGLTNLLQ